jgi:rhamnosyltransferase
MPENDSFHRTSPETLAVVSTYAPTTALLTGVKRLLDECTFVIMSDDGSPSGSEVLDEAEALGATVIRTTRNSGIAAALNRGISAGLDAHPDVAFVITMDQDSVLESGYVEAVILAHRRARRAGLEVGMLTPDRITGIPRRRSASRRDIALSGEPIQSGLALPVDAWMRLGPLREDLFIDGVDSEYFLRAHDAGLLAVVATNSVITHNLGTMNQAQLFGRPLTVKGRPIRVRTAAHWRYYFIMRNRILLIRSYGARHPWWAVKGLLADYRHLLLVSVLAPGRGARISMAVRGVRAGLEGVTGPGLRA